MKSRITIIAFVLLIASCTGSRRHLNIETKEIDYVNKSEFVFDGTPLDIQVNGLNEIMFCDSFLVTLLTDPENMIQAFDSKTFECVAKFGHVGRARNEFSQYFNTLEKMHYRRNDKTYFPLIDDGSVIKEVDFSSSVQNNEMVISTIRDYPIFAWGYNRMGLINNGYDTVFCSSEVEQDPVRKHRNHAPKYYIYDIGKQERTQIDVYSRVMKVKNEDYYPPLYYTRMYKHPQKNIFVCPFFNRDYMFYFNLDSCQYFAIHQTGTESFDSKLSEQQILALQDRLCFTSAEVTDDFILVMYLGGEDSKQHESVLPEILLFDWNGNYIAGAKLEKEVHDICFDKMNSKLYGANFNEEIIYQFDITAMIDRWHESN